MEHFKTEKAAPGRPPRASTDIENQPSYSLTAPPEAETPPTKPTRHDQPAPNAKRRPQKTKTSNSRQVRVVEFRNGEAVIRHPALRDLLDDGWRITSAVPHVEESDEIKLLVVMNRG